MVGLLLNPPVDLPLSNYTRLSGPNSDGVETQSVTAYTQTSASPFGLLMFSVVAVPAHGNLSRALRGWSLALNGGAHATKLFPYDPDRLSPADAGLSGNWSQGGGAPWTNGQNWSNGQGWQVVYPMVSPANAYVKGSSFVAFEDLYWGHALDVGSRFSFVGDHFAIYEVMQVITDGVYRIWPPLRKAVTTDDQARIDRMQIVARLSKAEPVSVLRGVSYQEAVSLTFSEVPHDLVAANFA